MTPNAEYWARVRARAKALGSDGCTFVSDSFMQDCCFEHDVHVRQGMTLRGMPISRLEADFVFRHCMQQRTAFRFLHPRTWLRWIGVRLGAWWAQRREG